MSALEYSYSAIPSQRPRDCLFHLLCLTSVQFCQHFPLLFRADLCIFVTALLRKHDESCPLPVNLSDLLLIFLIYLNVLVNGGGVMVTLSAVVQ